MRYFIERNEINIRKDQKDSFEEELPNKQQEEDIDGTEEILNQRALANWNPLDLNDTQHSDNLNGSH